MAYSDISHDDWLDELPIDFSDQGSIQNAYDRWELTFADYETLTGKPPEWSERTADIIRKVRKATVSHATPVLSKNRRKRPNKKNVRICSKCREESEILDRNGWCPDCD